ncbi:MAG: HlyD family efflux transporter periplasmic adaptor subunit [Bacteroidota bacterium]|nr:HlyD family efflux transporter periplasmic adaptor subunit [Bacteroidota bacterium]
MDIEIPKEIIRARKFKRSIFIGAFGAVIIIIIYGFYGFIKPSVQRSTLLTAIAEQGSIESTIAASGTVLPLNEQVITSPIEAKIEKVLHFAGEKISPGQPLLILNKEYSLIALEKLKEENSLKRNNITREKLNLAKGINELETKLEIQQLRVESLEALYEDEKKLIKIGGTTEDKLKQALLNLKVAQQEMYLTQKQISNLESAMVAELNALHIEIRIQEKSIEELERKIEQAEIKATTEGVVTYVNGDIGTTIKPGEQVAKIADLSSFKIEGTISDSYANFLNLGSAVLVKIQNNELRGTISKIQPAVSNGIIKFTIDLEEKDHSALRPSLRVDVFVVTSFKENAVKVKNGAFYKGSKNQKVFIIKDNIAYRKTINIGESNFDFVELQNEVQAGDEVIISDMKDYQHMEQIVLD